MIIVFVFRIGNHPTGDDIVTNSDFQENKNGRQSQAQTRNCCCVKVSSQCPNSNSQQNFNNNNNNNNGGFAGQPRVNSATKSFDDGISVRIVNDVS